MKPHKEEDKKKTLFNFIEKSISKIPNFPLSFSFFFFLIFSIFHNPISYTTKLQETTKEKIYILQSNLPIKLEKHHTTSI